MTNPAGVPKTTLALIVAAVLTAVGQILMLVLSIAGHGANSDPQLNDFNHAILGILVLLLGGKVAGVENAARKNGGG